MTDATTSSCASGPTPGATRRPCSTRPRRCFVASGVEAPVRDIAARAGVGVGTIYRHFPTRADLVVAVYRHQVEACADAGPALLASGRHAVRRARAVDRPLRRLPGAPSTGWRRCCSPTSAGYATLHA